MRCAAGAAASRLCSALLVMTGSGLYDGGECLQFVLGGGEGVQSGAGVVVGDGRDVELPGAGGRADPQPRQRQRRVEAGCSAPGARLAADSSRQFTVVCTGSTSIRW
jgi:hypothetical protein